MRFETQRVSAYLVQLLLAGAPMRRIIEDGGDIIQLELWSGKRVSIHLIESEIALYEIRATVEANNAGGWHTLFILWADMMLPADGQRYRPDDWMAALMALQGDKIYAYEAFGPNFYIFPVYFEGRGAERVARFGATIDVRWLGGRTVYVASPHLEGTWRVAGFEAAEETAEEDAAEHSPTRVGIEAYYAVLELGVNAERAAVKRAYRKLARAHHPDMTQAPDATARMQAINEAYRRILEYLDGGPTD